MTKKSVMIASPIGGQPAVEYMMSMMALVGELRARNIGYRYISVNGCSDLAYARNALAAQFLASGFTDLIWIDADMGFKPEGVSNLLASDKDFIGAAYRKRLHGGRELAALMGDDEPVRDADGLMPMRGVGFGLVKTSRRVYEAIMQARPDLRRPADHPQVEKDGLDLWRFFAFDGWGDGEDHRFCELWRRTGGTVWLDDSIETSHVGCCAYSWPIAAEGA